jgi:Ca-activated chloride channel family protein
MNGRFLLRCGFHTILSSLLLAIIMTASLAWPQSDEPVHVVPRKTIEQPVAETSVASIGSEPKLNAHVRPLRAGVDLVLVPVTITDALNRPVSDLAKSDFAVYEDNKQQEIRVFSKEDAPISIGLILDFSKSMTNKFEIERAAVSEFVKNANPQDDYFAIAFSDRPRLIADSTQSIDDLQSKLALALPAGNTALLDAIYLGVAKMRSARYQRRALLIISDGGDNHSHYNPKETKKLAEEADVLMYSIGIFDNMPVPVFKTIEEKLGKRLLTEITELTGGRTITADNREKVPEIAAVISREIRDEYVLAYRSTNAAHDGKWRKIKVQVAASSGTPPVHAHYKKGYIAPQQ